MKRQRVVLLAIINYLTSINRSMHMVGVTYICCSILEATPTPHPLPPLYSVSGFLGVLAFDSIKVTISSTIRE